MRTRERRTAGTRSTRRAFLLPNFTLALSIARLRALFAAFGLPAKLFPRATHQAIARLACEDGRRALVEAARSLGVDTRGWPLDEGVADLAAYMVLFAKTNDAAAKVVRRARAAQSPAVAEHVVRARGGVRSRGPRLRSVAGQRRRARARRLAVTARQLDAGDGSRHDVRANDALPTLETHLQIVVGYFSRLNVHVDIDDAPPPVDVVTQLPNIVRYSDMRWASHARAAAEALGLFAPGQLPDDTRTLAPYVHAEWRWVSVLGAATLAAMVRAALLRPGKTSKLAEKEHGALARSVTVHFARRRPPRVRRSTQLFVMLSV